MCRLRNIFISGLCISSLLLSSCGGESSLEWKFSRRIAREIEPDGWVYQFVNEYSKDGEIRDGNVVYSFGGFNLRYRYLDNQKITGNQTSSNSEQEGPAPIQSIDMISPKMEQDVLAINEYLYQSNRKSPEELLEDPIGQVEFQELDKELYLRLVNQALTSQPNRESFKYVDLPSYAILCEAEFLDGYKYQIGFLNGMGDIGVIYIDVLLEDSSMSHGYTQLSDLVENGEATDEQRNAFADIQALSEGIVQENDLLYGSDQYRTKTYGNIDFSRLYTFLENLSICDLDPYV